jgi:hypothetical protein
VVGQGRETSQSDEESPDDDSGTHRQSDR